MNSSTEFKLDFRKIGIKKRIEEQANYSSIFMDGKTVRIPLDRTREITELHFPEFYDVSFANRCSGGCSYCYASALKSGVYYKNLAQKIHSFFGRMTENQRPYQVAIGGESDALEHPEVWEALEAFRALDIVPNLTTNGMFVNEKTVPKILKYSSGIAVTFHPHLEKCWRRAIELLSSSGVTLNVHVIVSDKESCDDFLKKYDEFASKVSYFVLLPYRNVGHAANNPKSVDWDALKVAMDAVYKDGKIAVGANGYPFLKQHEKHFGLQLYSPEILSKYLIMNDDMKVYNNSFDKKEVPYNPETGCSLGFARTDFSM